MSLWTPNGQVPSSEITSAVELYDSDILAMERGPIAWARSREGNTLHIDQFTKDLTEQFALIGFGVDVQVWSTAQDDTYAFKIEIQRRLGSQWDPDRQVHEVVNNVLDLPDQEGGWIKTDEAMKEHERRRKEQGLH